MAGQSSFPPSFPGRKPVSVVNRCFRCVPRPFRSRLDLRAFCFISADYDIERAVFLQHGLRHGETDAERADEEEDRPAAGRPRGRGDDEGHPRRARACTLRWDRRGETGNVAT